MDVLVVDDDGDMRDFLSLKLDGWGYRSIMVDDGAAAWDLFAAGAAPKIAILDWIMPTLDGPTLCRRVRELDEPLPTYIIMLTARDHADDLVDAFEAGINDYVVKPFAADELLARIRVGERMIKLQRALRDRVSELEAALSRVRKLEELLPICSYCMKVRQDGDYWQQVDSYLMECAGVRLSHGICPECLETKAMPQLEAMRKARDEKAASS